MSALSPLRARKSTSSEGGVVQYDGTNYRIKETVLLVGCDVAVNCGRGGRTNDVNSWLATLISNEYRGRFRGSTSAEEKGATLRSIYQLVLDKGGNFWDRDGRVAPKDVAVKYIRKMIVGAATKKSTSLPNLTPASFSEEEFSDHEQIEPTLHNEIADAEALGEDYPIQSDDIEPSILHDETAAVADDDTEVLNEGENGLHALYAMFLLDSVYEDMIENLLAD